MKSSSLSRNALSVCTAAILLAGCGALRQAQGDTQTIPAESPMWRAHSANANSAIDAPRHHHSKTFNYTGAQQNFMVPSGVAHVTVQAYGGISASTSGGGYVKATIPVTPGETLAIYVGGNSSGATAGFNGGGSGGSHNSQGGAGASDIRQGGSSLTNRVVIAGGEGGDGGAGFAGDQGAGGAGGGLVGGSGGTDLRDGGGGGGGGGQSAGGGGGQGCGNRFNDDGNGGAGMLGIGGAGGFDLTPCGAVGGGGGGGGYYGGGGGGSGKVLGTGRDYAGGGGGGGGSSYIEPGAKNVTNTQGGSTGGLIIISW